MSKMKDKLAASVRHARDAQGSKPAAKPITKPAAAKPATQSAVTKAAAAKPAVTKPAAAQAVAAKHAPAKSAEATNTHAGGIADSRNQLFPARVWPD